MCIANAAVFVAVSAESTDILIVATTNVTETIVNLAVCITRNYLVVAIIALS